MRLSGRSLILHLAGNLIAGGRYLEVLVVKLQDNERLRSFYMAYVDDGILDIFVGWIFFFAGLMILTDMIWLAGIYVALFIPVMWSAKEHITIPRLGRDELLAISRQKAFNSKTAAIVGLVLLGVISALATFTGLGYLAASNVRQVILVVAAGLIGAVLLAGFVTAARNYQAPRWYIYGALLAFFALLAYLFSIGLPWLLMVLGAVISLTGTFYLARFIRDHAILPLVERPY